MNISIIPVSMSEVDLLHNIIKQTFIDAFASQNTVEDMEQYIAQKLNMEQILSELKNPHSEFYFAKSNNQTIGYIKLNTKSAQSEFLDDHAMELARIYILKEFQNQSFGHSLLQFAIETARASNASLIWLGVWEKNIQAIRFYEKHGFKSFDSHTFLLGSDLQTDILMKLSLEY